VTRRGHECDENPARPYRAAYRRSSRALSRRDEPQHVTGSVSGVQQRDGLALHERDGRGTTLVRTARDSDLGRGSAQRDEREHGRSRRECLAYGDGALKAVDRDRRGVRLDKAELPRRLRGGGAREA